MSPVDARFAARALRPVHAHVQFGRRVHPESGRGRLGVLRRGTATTIDGEILFSGLQLHRHTKITTTTNDNEKKKKIRAVTTL